MKSTQTSWLQYGPSYSAKPPAGPTDAGPEEREAPGTRRGGGKAKLPSLQEMAVIRVVRTNEIVTWAVLAPCLVGWTVVGFVLWIPRVLRGVLLFSAAMVQSTVQETGPTSAGRRLRSAANFYKRGYVGAIAAVRSALEQDEDEDEDDADGAWKIDSAMITREATWSLAVWYVVLWPALIHGTPFDIVTPLVDAPWSQIWWEIVRVFTSVPDLFGG